MGLTPRPGGTALRGGSLHRRDSESHARKEPLPASTYAPRGPNLPVTLRCFPADDPAFARQVHLAVAGLVASASLEAVAPRLQGVLRESHPLVVVQAMDPLARLGDEAGSVWYVYRDGTAIGVR